MSGRARKLCPCCIIFGLLLWIAQDFMRGLNRLKFRDCLSLMPRVSVWMVLFCYHP